MTGGVVPGGVVTGSPAARRLESPTLVGRTAELQAMVAAVTAPPAVVVVEGEAGIGKTRLVRELAASPEVAGRRWLRGGCRGIRDPFPLGPVLEAVRGVAAPPVALSPVAGALRPLLPELAGWLPEPPPALADRAGERHRVFRGLASLLAALGPTVLVLEDLHWADAQTCELITYLGAELPPGLSLVLTFRGDEVAATVRTATARLPATVGQAQLVLPPLDTGETGRLAAAILQVPRVPDEFAAQLCQRAAGLPFAVEELLALLRTRGRPATAAALAELDVPAGIRDLTLARVAGLSPAGRAAVEAAATLEVPAPVDVLAAVCGRPRSRLLRDLAEVVAAGLLTGGEGGELVGFRHPLAAQAVYQATLGPRRSDLHARAAAALRRHDPVPLGQVAHHLRRAGETAAWVDAAEQAADQAVALGHDAEAARLLTDVLAHARLEPARRGRVAVTLARAAVQTIHVTGEVTRLLTGVLASAGLPPATRGELAFRLAVLHEAAGDDVALVRRHYLEAVERIDPTDRPDLAAWVMLGLAVPTLPEIPGTERRDWLRRSLALVPQIEDPAFGAFLLGKAAMLRAVTGDPGWRELTARLRAVPEHRWGVIACQSAAMALAYTGHHPEADRLLTAAAAGATACQSRELDLRVRATRALLDYSCGRWDGLDDTVVWLLDELVDYPAGRLDVEVVAGGLALAEGDLAAAQEHLTAVVERAEERVALEAVGYALAGLTRLAVARGEPDAVRERLRRLPATAAAKDWWLPLVRVLPVATEVLPAAEASALVAQAEGQLSGLDSPLAPAAVDHARGLVAAAGGRYAEAAGLLARAAVRYQRAGCRYEAALGYEQAAGAYLAGGERAAGEAALGAALATFDRLGADWDRRRASRTARRYGLAVPVSRRGGGRGYGDQLSPRERQVAELAATGRTNKQIGQELFLSPKTVDKHIGAALRKLGVHTRSALARRLDNAP